MVAGRRAFRKRIRFSPNRISSVQSRSTLFSCADLVTIEVQFSVEFCSFFRQRSGSRSLSDSSIPLGETKWSRRSDVGSGATGPREGTSTAHDVASPIIESSAGSLSADQSFSGRLRTRSGGQVTSCSRRNSLQAPVVDSTGLGSDSAFLTCLSSGRCRQDVDGGVAKRGQNRNGRASYVWRIGGDGVAPDWFFARAAGQKLCGSEVWGSANHRDRGSGEVRRAGSLQFPQAGPLRRGDGLSVGGMVRARGWAGPSWGNLSNSCRCLAYICHFESEVRSDLISTRRKFVDANVRVWERLGLTLNRLDKCRDYPSYLFCLFSGKA